MTRSRIVSILCLALLIAAPAQASEYPMTGVMYAGGYAFLGGVPTIGQVAGFDVLVSADLHKVAGPEKMARVLGLNPDLKLLYYGPAVAVNLYGYQSELLSHPGFKEDYLLHETSGKRITWWGGNMVFFNMTSPEAVTWLVDYNQERFVSAPCSHLFHGFFFDMLHYRLWDFMTGAVKPADIDADRDGRPDSQAAFDAAWSSGIIGFLTQLKTRFPSHMIVGNDAPPSLGEYHEVLNGALFELYVQKWYDLEQDQWADLINGGAEWVESARSPAFSLATFYGPDDIVWNGGFRDPYKPWNEMELWRRLGAQVKAMRSRMRFGLGAATLAGLVYCYEWGTSAYGNAYWRFPEYDANGRGLHYLGRPVSPPRKITQGTCDNIIANWDFEKALMVGDWYIEDCHGVPGAYGRTTTNPFSGAQSGWVRANEVSSEFWHVQLRQNVSLVQGQQYRATFAARADSPRRIVVQVLREETYENIWWTWFDIGTEWREYSFDFTATLDASGNKARFGFYVGTSTSTVYVDQVRLTGTGCSTLMLRDFERGRVYVNAEKFDQTAIPDRVLFDLEGRPAGSVTIPARDAVFLITDPGWRGNLPDDSEQIACPYTTPGGGSDGGNDGGGGGGGGCFVSID